MTFQIALLVLQTLIILMAFKASSYMTKKGENIATKEDISDITEIVEKIKKNNSIEIAELSQEHRLYIKQIEQHNDLRLASIDERLKAHQEAYTLVFEMLDSITHREKAIETGKKVTKFWTDRSLYISEEAREALDQAMRALNSHTATLTEGYHLTPKENIKRISNALRAIEEAVNLPSLNSRMEEIMVSEK